MSPSVELTLPYPPSTNRLWRYLAGRAIKSAQYRAWEALASADVASQGAGHVVGRRLVGPYTLRMAVGRPDNRRRDIDNLIKPVNDLLVASGVVGDDADCQTVEAGWESGLEGLRVTVSLTARVPA